MRQFFFITSAVHRRSETLRAEVSVVLAAARSSSRVSDAVTNNQPYSGADTDSDSDAGYG